MGPVIGGALGVLVIVVLAATMVRWITKRRARDRHALLNEFDGKTEPLGPCLVTPFNTKREDSASLSESVDPTQTGFEVNPHMPNKVTGVMRSRKEREAGFTLANPDTSQVHGNGSSSPSADVLEQQYSADARVTPSEVGGLRAEVENLREAVRRIQNGRPDSVSEAPPGYHFVNVDA